MARVGRVVGGSAALGLGAARKTVAWCEACRAAAALRPEPRPHPRYATRARAVAGAHNVQRPGHLAAAALAARPSCGAPAAARHVRARYGCEG